MCHEKNIVRCLRGYRPSVCICLAMYVLFGFRMHCGSLCHATTTVKIDDVSEVHLEQLYEYAKADSTNLDQSSMTTFLSALNLSPSSHIHTHDDSQHDHATSDNHESHDVPGHKCYNASELFNLFSPKPTELTRKQFNQLLPTLMYEVSTGACSYHHHHHDSQHRHGEEKHSMDWKVILACAGVGLVITLSGFLVFFLIPFISRNAFAIIKQFLIALSAGCLVGDALLHLIPHAILGSHEHHTDHNSSSVEHSKHQVLISKALVGVVGIYVFFFTERATILFQNFRSSKKTTKEQQQQQQQHHVMEQKTETNNSIRYINSNGTVLSYINEDQSSSSSRLCNGGPATAIVENCANDDDNVHKIEQLESENSSSQCDYVPSGTQCNQFPDEIEKSDQSLIDLQQSSSGHQPTDPSHPHSDRPHGHHHGHSHDFSSIRAIAWTIMAGDFLHNLCDGIAIGAAFANGISSGLSTSIAVLCHELPHEFGDFVIIIDAGMSVRRALLYQCLSSLLCIAGIVVGLFIGHEPSTISWLFMLISGMFIYIALVDMMPELSTNKIKTSSKYGHPLCLFLFHNIGLLLGIGAMLLIALFEHDMSKLF